LGSGREQKKKDMTTTSRRKYLYVPLQIVDVYAPLSLSNFNFCVSSRILWLKSLAITGLKSCVTVLLTVMRTNVLLFAGFWSVWSYFGAFPTFSLDLAFLSALLA
jgi:hypothetical protein